MTFKVNGTNVRRAKLVESISDYLELLWKYWKYPQHRMVKRIRGSVKNAELGILVWTKYTIKA